MATENKIIRLRMDSSTDWETNNPTLQPGEIAVIEDSTDFVINNTSSAKAFGSCQTYKGSDTQTTAGNGTITIKTSGNATVGTFTVNQTGNTTITLPNYLTSSSTLLRKVDYTSLDELSGQLTIDANFVEQNANTDFVTTIKALGSGNQFTFDSSSMNSKNMITFSFMTDSALVLDGSGLFTNDPASVPNKIQLFINAGSVNVNTLFDGSTVTIPANYSVNMQYINGTMLIINLCKW